jgi:hypothetical protein
VRCSDVGAVICVDHTWPFDSRSEVLLYEVWMANVPRRAKPGEAPTEITAAPAVQPTSYYWLVAGGIAALGAVVGLLFMHYRNPPPGAGFGAFATIYVLAQAIERILEPVNHFLKLGGDPDAAATADERARVHANRVAVCFGLASGLAMIACGYFGVGLLHAIGDDGSPRYADVIVTGLAIGGATKPLHDLITIVDSAARRRKAPPA